MTESSTSLSTLERRNLKAHAHHLDPVVMIGHEGATDAVLAAINVQLLAHELIKVRVFSEDRTARALMANQICEQLDAQLVQHIGKLLVLFRPHAQGSKIDATVPYTAAAAIKKTVKKSAEHVSKKLLAAGKTIVKRKPRTTNEQATTARHPEKIAQENRKSAQRSSRRGARRTR